MKTETGAFVTQDAAKCTGCKACELACFAAHQNYKGNTVGTVTRTVAPKLFVTRKGKLVAPIQCKHCENAPCMNACPKGAIKKENNQVIIQGEMCEDCTEYECIMACPFDAIRLFPDTSKCDLCVGREKGPACVEVCTNQALRLVDPEKELEEKRKRAAQYLKYMI